MKKASQYFGEFAIDSVDLPLLALCQKKFMFFWQQEKKISTEIKS
jgi:hypothetical protein